MVEKKENKRKTHCSCVLLEHYEWGMVVAGSDSLCGVRIRRGRESSDQNPIVVKLWRWN